MYASKTTIACMALRAMARMKALAAEGAWNDQNETNQIHT